MSLINEALKKAQKLRSGDPAGTLAPMPGGTPRVTKRGEARSTQQLVLIASGAVVLVVLSVVATFWFLNRAPAPKPAPKPVAVKPVDNSTPEPVIIAPSLPPPVTTPETAPTKPATVVVERSPPATTPGAALVTTTASKPPVTTPPVKPVTETPPPATDTPSPAAAAQPATPTAPSPAPAAAADPVATDPRVHAFVDAVKVAGIRSSGGDSRVLMNDRVFRVNDIVDRNLGVRITKVEANALTFTDSNGAIYVKNF